MKDQRPTDNISSLCALCPRRCGADRASGEVGVCGQGNEIRISRAAPHMFEEPIISGQHGSGTVFFCGCPLRCVFCQNRDISRGHDAGRVVSAQALADIFLELQDLGVHNVNLVTPTHFARGIARALELAKPKLTIPVVYNTSGYELEESLKMFEGLVDIYMPDFKYVSSELSAKYSCAPDYAEVAERAIREMYRQVGRYQLGEDGMMTRGLLVRHLVLPAARHDSIAVLDTLARALPREDILLSLMSQYTPEFAQDAPYPELHRRITSFEYSSVVDHAQELGFEGFIQGRASASAKYTPDFKKE